MAANSGSAELSNDEEDALSAPLVAVLGTRYFDLGIEEEVLARFSPTFVADPAGSPDALLAAAAEADVVLAGSAPKFTADSTLHG